MRPLDDIGLAEEDGQARRYRRCGSVWTEANESFRLTESFDAERIGIGNRYGSFGDYEHSRSTNCRPQTLWIV